MGYPNTMQKRSFFGSSKSKDSKAEENEKEKENGEGSKNEDKKEEGKESQEEPSSSTSSSDTKGEEAEENPDLKKKMMYTLAEMENVRQIAKRDVDQGKQFAIKGFAKSLLDVADNLDRAIESVPTSLHEYKEKKEEISEETRLTITLLEGVEMTNTELQKVFVSQKLVKYGVQGEKFDPNLHDALFEIPDPSQEAGTIGQVVKAGYTLQGRVLRAAQVGTIKKL